MIRFFNQAVGATSPNAKPSNKVIGMAMMKFFEISDNSFNIVFSRTLASGWPTRSDSRLRGLASMGQIRRSSNRPI